MPFGVSFHRCDAGDMHRLTTLRCRIAFDRRLVAERQAITPDRVSLLAQFERGRKVRLTDFRNGESVEALNLADGPGCVFGALEQLVDTFKMNKGSCK